MRILLIRFSSIGDVALTTGVINCLKLSMPGVQVDALTFSGYELLWPGANNIYTVKKGISLKDYIKFVKAIPGYDLIVDLHDNIRSALARRLIPGKTAIYDKQAFKRRLYTKFRLFKNDLKKHVVQKYADAVFTPLGLEIPDLENLRPVYKNNSATDPQKIVIHPFASKFTKTWGDFSKIVKPLEELGFNVFIVGRGYQGANSVTTHTLKELMDFMSDAALVVSTDSGPLHLAVALNRNVLALFGSTVKEFGFYPDFTGATVLEKKLGCRPCDVHGLDACPLKEAEKKMQCMRFGETVIMEKICMILMK